MRKIFFYVLWVLICISPAGTQAQDNRAARAGKAFEQMLSDNAFKHATSAFVVLDGSNGQLLYGYNENVGLATASTLKTITAAAAMYRLGPQYRYKTRLQYTGQVINGVLQGNLIVKGSGDPMLGSSREKESSAETILKQFVAFVRQHNIKAVTGSIIGDDRIFGTQTTPNEWPYQEIGNYYGAGACGLNWADNQFDVLLDRDARTRGMEPTLPYIKIVNELRSGEPGSGDNAYGFLMPYTTTAYLRGTWAPDVRKDRIALSLPDPAYECARRLKTELEQAGITCGEATTTRIGYESGKPAGNVAGTLGEIESPPMTTILKWFLTKSINMYGESLLRTMAAVETGDGSTETGVKTMKRFWQVKGLDPATLNIFDGSGLSPSNRVTPLTMAEILYKATQEPWFRSYVAGFPTYNNMVLKSGTITNVHGYAGYHTSPDGHRYIVVINSNNYSGGSITPKLFKVLDNFKS